MGNGKKTTEELEKQLEECQKLKEEYLAGWQRSRADFINYKKEEMERISELIKYSNEEMVLKFLPVLDSFDLAQKQISEDLKKDKNLQGLLQIRNQIMDFFKSLGLEEIRCLNENFDPNLHEAVGEIEAKDAEKGIVIEELQKGYRIQGRLLRPAKVKVTK